MPTYSLNKSSHLVTVDPQTPLLNLKKNLVEEGVHLGFAPIENADQTIEYYLTSRSPNLYYFRHGSLSDLVSSMEIELKNGETYRLQDAPRSAMGPDFNRMIIGSGRLFGQIRSVTLRVSALPEQIRHGVIDVKSEIEAQELATYLVGHFFRPLYFCYFPKSSFGRLGNICNSKKKSNGGCFMFCFSGLRDMTETLERTFQKHCESINKEISWLGHSQHGTKIRSVIHHDDTYDLIREQYASFIWPKTEPNSQNTLEKILKQGA